MGYIEGVGREQQILFPESLDEYVTAENPVRVIDLFVSMLDMAELGFVRSAPAQTGRPGYDPRHLLRLYIYGYVNRVRSSRRLEAEAERNVEVMWLLGKLRPDFKTIADFRRDHVKALKQVYRHFTEFCRQAGLLGGERVAVDGSKFQASNARGKNQTQSGLKKALEEMEKRIARYLRELDEVDAEEAQQGEMKLQKVKARKEELEALLKKMQESGQTQRSQTDPESRRMPVRGGGTGICYNVQIAVDEKHHLIVSYAATNEANDLNQLSTVAVAAKEALGVEALEVVADKGYYDGAEIAACVAAGITPAVPATQSSKNGAKELFTPEHFHYDAGRDAYSCPAGQTLVLLRQERHDGRLMGIYANRQACKGCPLAGRCHENREGRYIRRPPEAPLLEQMRERLMQHPELMRVRKKIAEHPFGTMKRAMDQGYFLLRGLQKVSGEFALSALAYNLKRALSVLGAARLMEALRAWRPERGACLTAA